MFEKKLNSLLNTGENTSNNKFLNVLQKETSVTLSGNGAKKYTTSGNPFLDQFSKASHYLKPRTYEDIARDMSILWSIDPVKAVKLTLFFRIITREPKLLNGKKLSLQKGNGLKHESIMRMIWLAINQPDTFYKNLPLLIAAGSWRDIFEMLRYDLMYHGWQNKVLNWDKITDFILAGLENEEFSDLVKKYLPTIRSRSNQKTLRQQANTIIGKYIASKLFAHKKYEKYRKLKNSGKAHEWQKLISKRLFDAIDFDTIHGRALTQLASSNFLENHGLEEKFLDWIKEQPVAKFTGYPFELVEKYGNPCSINLIKRTTMDKQFDYLIKEKLDSKLMVVRDISGSMTGLIPGKKISAGSVAKSLSIYFSSMLEGHFKNTEIVFAAKPELNKFYGNTFSEKWCSEHRSFIGNTDFYAVIKLLVKLRKQGVPEEEFPNGLLLISDGEFDKVGAKNTNFEKAFEKMRKHFSDKFIEGFKIIFWDIPNNFYWNNPEKKFETIGNHNNVFYLSGFDGSIISFIFGKEDNGKIEPKDAEELMEIALSQELLNLVEV